MQEKLENIIFVMLLNRIYFHIFVIKSQHFWCKDPSNHLIFFIYFKLSTFVFSGDTSVVIFKMEAAESKIATVVVRGATENYMDDIERAIDDGVNTYKGGYLIFIQKKKICPFSFCHKKTFC